MQRKGFPHEWPSVTGIRQWLTRRQENPRLPIDSPNKGSVIRSFVVCFAESLNHVLRKKASGRSYDVTVIQKIYKNLEEAPVGLMNKMYTIYERNCLDELPITVARIV